MKKRRNLNAFLNIAIAALSVTAVFTVFKTLELETSETPPISLGTSITVISEPEPFTESGAGGITDEMSETTPPQTTAPAKAAVTTPPTADIVAQTVPLAASNDANSRFEMDFSAVIEDVEVTTAKTEAESTSKTTAPSVKATTAKTTTKKVLDLHEESEAAEFQLFEEYEEEQSLIVITLPPATTTAATTTTPATSFITGYTDPTTATTTATPESAPSAIIGSEQITATVNGSRATYDTYDLVCGIVNAEIGSIFDDEAIKAQAVAAYTYLKYNVANGTTPSVYYKANYSERIKTLTAEVYGQAIYYDGKYVQSVYAASTAGTTASAKTVWNINLPYLVSVQTPFDLASDPHYGLRKSFTVSEIKSALESYLNITLSDNPANWLSITARVDGAYVSELSVDGQKTVSGRKMRENILDFDLKSAAFDVVFDGQNFVFTTYGYGHGVGLSQYGANILAEQGYSYVEILKYYYTGVEVR